MNKNQWIVRNKRNRVAAVVTLALLAAAMAAPVVAGSNPPIPQLNPANYLRSWCKIPGAAANGQNGDTAAAMVRYLGLEIQRLAADSADLAGDNEANEKTKEGLEKASELFGKVSEVAGACPIGKAADAASLALDMGGYAIDFQNYNNNSQIAANAAKARQYASYVKGWEQVRKNCCKILKDTEHNLNNTQKDKKKTPKRGCE